MITGFNTDVEYEGTVYHVQTEDKGLDSPLILSLVYVGGAILASKRSRYDDLIAKGFEERELAERLNRQHKLICAAIRAGRIEDLKRMSQREGSAAAAAPAASPVNVAPKPAKPAPVEEADPLEIPPAQPAVKAPVPEKKVEKRSAPKPVAATPAPTPTQPEAKVKKVAQKSSAKPNVRAILQDVVADFARAEAASEAGLHLSLLDEKEFRGGTTVILNIRVGRGSNGKEAISGADVTVKVLGSTFRPLIFPTHTGPDGIAQVRTVLLHFKTGRAALLVRAIADGYEAELRRIIHQG
ncbi:MAG: hypothetical protein ICV60_21480 [Pyrinomonadaceae bacterium]|nr:hypothetical protein [Pyrinomonadaceae bacterium]